MIYILLCIFRIFCYDSIDVNVVFLFIVYQLFTIIFHRIWVNTLDENLYTCESNRITKLIQVYPKICGVNVSKEQTVISLIQLKLLKKLNLHFYFIYGSFIICAKYSIQRTICWKETILLLSYPASLLITWIQHSLTFNYAYLQIEADRRYIYRYKY